MGEIVKKGRERTMRVPTFVKWAGGKKQLLPQLIKLFPGKIEKYFEPFVGGGSIAFYMAQNHTPTSIFISDMNKELINVYSVIKNNLSALIKSLKKHKEKHGKKYYYKIRNLNTSKLSRVARASRFIYLNKTCFNGLYRVNLEGKFNVPIGSYKNPEIFQEKGLKLISKLLKKINMRHMSFKKIVPRVNAGDFIYLDPPYYPLKKGKGFTTYTKNNFLEQDQTQLAQVFRELDEKGCKVMLSNSNTKFIKNLYKGFEIKTVTARRMINCDATKRGKIKEIVVTNFKV